MVVEGGWNPAFAAISERAAERGGGVHVVIRSEHHFPQLVSEELNEQLGDFMGAAHRRVRKPALRRPRRDRR